VMLCGWEGKSGIALAMRHRLSGISTYRLPAQWPGKGRWAMSLRNFQSSVAWWYNGVGLAVKMSRGQLAAVWQSCNDSHTHTHTHVPLSSCSIVWYWINSSDLCG